MAPVPLIRRNYIIRKLRKCGAFSPQAAVTFEQAGIFNPKGFSGVTSMMIRRGQLAVIDNRYYLTEKTDRF